MTCKSRPNNWTTRAINQLQITMHAKKWRYNRLIWEPFKHAILDMQLSGLFQGRFSFSAISLLHALEKRQILNWKRIIS